MPIVIIKCKKVKDTRKQNFEKKKLKVEKITKLSPIKISTKTIIKIGMQSKQVA